MLREDVIQAGFGNSGGCFLFQQIEDGKHYLLLEFLFALHLQQLFGHFGIVGIGHHIADCVFKTGLFDQFGHNRLEIGVVVWGNILIFFLHDVRSGAFDYGPWLSATGNLGTKVCNTPRILKFIWLRLPQI